MFLLYSLYFFSGVYFTVVFSCRFFSWGVLCKQFFWGYVRSHFRKVPGPFFSVLSAQFFQGSWLNIFFGRFSGVNFLVDILRILFSYGIFQCGFFALHFSGAF